MVENKVTKIRDVQKTYFSLLRDCFKDQYRAVQETEGDVEKGLTKWIDGRKDEEVVYTFKRRFEDIENFWKNNYIELKDKIINTELMPIYSINRPMYLERIFSSAGLYVDTVVCHDDIISGIRNLNVLPSSRAMTIAFNMVCDYLFLLSIEKCFINDLEVPFGIICPGERDFDVNIEKDIINYSQNLMIEYTNDLLETNYESWEELEEHTKKLLGNWICYQHLLKNRIMMLID